jgi:hypothetical protein
MKYGQNHHFRRRAGGLPAWLVFLVGIALVLGSFYLWEGFQRFIRTGGLGVAEATQRAVAEVTATAERATRVSITRTPLPTPTPLPQCQDFVVVVVGAPNALVRELPGPQARIMDAYPSGEIVCVLGRDPGSEYYTIDTDTTTRRFELGYMHESVLEAVNPTPTPSATVTMPPTITPVPSDTLAPNQPVLATATVESAQPTLPPRATLNPTEEPTLGSG